MHLTGLERLKNVTLDIYERLFRLQGMDASKRPAETLNFLFLGNPGTGKTTVARLFGKLLIELGVRKSDGAFNETSGNKLKQMGRQKAEELVDNSIGGVLFVDEAYDLNPQDSQVGGKEILDHIMEVAEKNRLDISIILAGFVPFPVAGARKRRPSRCCRYQEDMDKLMSYNDGMPSRFPHTIVFDDFTEGQLADLFKKLVTDRGWTLDHDRVAAVAGKRLARRCGKKGFGNARDCRTAVESALSRALLRPAFDPEHPCLTVEDIVGLRPNAENNPKLKEVREAPAMQPRNVRHVPAGAGAVRSADRLGQCQEGHWCHHHRDGG